MERRFAILMQYGIDRVLRNRAITVAVILLLSVSIVIGNFGWISYMVTCQQVEAIDDAYSTLASPSRSYDVAYDRQSSSWQLTYSSGGKEIRRAYSPDDFSAVTADERLVTSKSEGRAVGGIVHGLIVPSKYGSGNAILPESAGVNYAVFLVTCTSEPVFEDDLMRFSADVNEALSIHPDYPVPDALTVRLEEIGFDEDGNPLVRLGEQYVVWGQYTTTTYLYGVGEIQGYEEDVSQRSLLCHALRPYQKMTSQYYEKGLLRWRLPDKDHPEILSPSDDRVSNLVDSVRELRETVPVYGLGTAGLNGLMSFHTGLYYLTEGRDFSADELKSGADVCVISKQLAERNGLQLGSRLSLSVFDNGSLYNINATTDAAQFHMNAMPDAFERTTAEYTVIGIYSGPAAQEHIDSLPLHTILVPETTLPTGVIPAQRIQTNMGYSLSIPETQIGTKLPVLQTFVLSKGQSGAFVQALADIGMEDLYKVHDNGYHRIAALVQCMAADARLLLIICVTAEVLLVLCVLGFYTLQRRHEHRILVRLGATRGWVCTYYAAGLCLISLCAWLLGNGISYCLNSSFIELMNEYSLLSLNVFRNTVLQQVSSIHLTMSQQLAIWGIHASLLLVMDAMMLLPGCACQDKPMQGRRKAA